MTENSEKTVTVSNYGYNPMEVDEEIAPLIENMLTWCKLEINSCTKSSNHVCIEFRTSSDCEKFLDICFGDQSDDIVKKAFGGESAWVYEVKIFSEDSWNKYSEKVKKYNVGMVVKFPVGDYEWVYERVLVYDGGDVKGGF
jgi:hypothetical protein